MTSERFNWWRALAQVLGSIEAVRIARMAAQGGASALLVFPPAPFTLGQSPAMALAHV